MPTLPRPQLGLHLVYVKLYPQTIAGGGGMTDGTLIQLLAAPPSALNQTMGLSYNYQVQREEINAMNTQQLNEVPIAAGWSMELDFFKVNNGNTPDPLLAVYANPTFSGYFRATWQEGNVTGSIATYTFYGSIGDSGNTGRGRGVAQGHLALGPCDPGFPTTPQFSVAYT